MFKSFFSFECVSLQTTSPFSLFLMLPQLHSNVCQSLHKREKKKSHFISIERRMSMESLLNDLPANGGKFLVFNFDFTNCSARFEGESMVFNAKCLSNLYYRICLCFGDCFRTTMDEKSKSIRSTNVYVYLQFYSGRSMRVYHLRSMKFE